MCRSIRSRSAFAFLVVGLWLALGPLAAQSVPGDGLVLVENRGQWDTPARFVARMPGTQARLEPGAMVLEYFLEQGKNRVSGVLLRLAFEGSNERARIRGLDRRRGYHNFFVGETERWRARVPAYRCARYLELYPGVDVVVRKGAVGLEYDLHLAPGADLDAVVIRCDGADELLVDDDGGLTIRTGANSVRQAAPRTWYESPSGAREPVDCRFRKVDRHRFAFVVNARDLERPLVIDPGLEWSTFIAGSGWDQSTNVEVDASGVAFNMGWSFTHHFPTTPGAFSRTHHGNLEAFVTRVKPDGSGLTWSTFIGGSQNDGAHAVAIWGAGYVTVVGGTQSPDFPTTKNAFASKHQGNWDGWVALLDPAGSRLIYSTYLGGTGNDHAREVVLDQKSGAALVCGSTGSTNFPTTSLAFDRTLGGTMDAWVARLTVDGSALVYSTYVGGSGVETDWVTALTVNTVGEVTVVGQTYSSDFPTTSGAYDTTHNGASDGFVTRLNAAGSGLKFSTFLGGAKIDRAIMVAEGPFGIVVVGGTQSTGFPTTAGAYDRSHNGSTDVFVTRLNRTASSLLYSTFLGGSNLDDAERVQVDSAGAAVVVGTTDSGDFPTTAGTFASTYGGGGDAFVARLHPTGTSLSYASYLGGSAWDRIMAVGLGPTGAAIVSGYTKSSNFPTTPGAYQTTYQGGTADPFLTKMDLLPVGVRKYGSSTPACGGPLAINVTRQPRAGDAGFAFTCTNAPPSSVGMLAIGLAPHVAGLPIAGARIHVLPAAPFAIVPANSNAAGAAETTVPIPAGTRGYRLYCQYVWTTPPGCPAGRINTSNALDIMIQ